ncbi:hypothetical protein [Capnocytophaga cynodegmi]|uniref:hypothetical protein n=1 Tax=Capnocytophaga cynodegmi TaxID=28189 RepID=UPI000AB5DC8D|nr:hypothetical protein [Capnocytophaga cynodegmi]
MAILVTALIGWQIFNVIQFENRFEKIRKQLKMDIENKVNKETTKTYIDVFDMLKSSPFIYQTTLFLLKALHKSEGKNIPTVLGKVNKLVKSHKEKNIFITPYIREEERDYLLKEIENLPENKKQKSEVKELTEILRDLSFFASY